MFDYTISEFEHWYLWMLLILPISLVPPMLGAPRHLRVIQVDGRFIEDIASLLLDGRLIYGFQSADLLNSIDEWRLRGWLAIHPVWRGLLENSAQG